MPKIGNNEFIDVNFPLILKNKYFLCETVDSVDTWTVFTIDGRKVNIASSLFQVGNL